MTSIPEPTSMANLANGTWDAWNRLVWYIDSSLNYHNSLYDGLSRRITYAEADTPRDYYYSNQWQILEERIPPNTGVADRQFVWGLRYIDDCIVRDRTTTGTLSERLFAMQDANWNVVAICNTAATVLERYAYTAYGVVLFLNASFVPLSGNASAYAWEILYSGYQYDSAVGLYLVRNRWLDAPLGSWLSRDPLNVGSVPSSVDALLRLLLPTRSSDYAFARSSPLGRVDALGLADDDACKTCSKRSRGFVVVGTLAARF
jgi:RHS repeat-associated protein